MRVERGEWKSTLRPLISCCSKPYFFFRLDVLVRNSTARGLGYKDGCESIGSAVLAVVVVIDWEGVGTTKEDAVDRRADHHEENDDGDKHTRGEKKKD